LDFAPEHRGKTETRTAEVQTKAGERLVFEWNTA
jgi:hypothetical protein